MQRLGARVGRFVDVAGNKEVRNAAAELSLLSLLSLLLAEREVRLFFILLNDVIVRLDGHVSRDTVKLLGEQPARPRSGHGLRVIPVSAVHSREVDHSR